MGKDVLLISAILIASFYIACYSSQGQDVVCVSQDYLSNPIPEQNVLLDEYKIDILPGEVRETSLGTKMFDSGGSEHRVRGYSNQAMVFSDEIKSLEEGYKPGVSEHVGNEYTPKTISTTPDGQKFELEHPQIFVGMMSSYEVKPIEVEIGSGDGQSRRDLQILEWGGSNMSLVLYAPNGTMISPTADIPGIIHKKGPTYDYYIMENATPGKWNLLAVPLDVDPRGERYSLVSSRIANVEPDDLIADLRLTIKAEETQEKKERSRKDLKDLSWEGSRMALILFAPDGTMISPTAKVPGITHKTGRNFDAYILEDAMAGNWTMKVVPLEVPTRGEKFTLVTGMVEDVAETAEGCNVQEDHGG